MERCEKLKWIGDINNAFLLCSLHDKLFDKFLISFTDEGKLIISKILLSSISTYGFKDITIPQIRISEKNIFYLKKHRELSSRYELNRTT